MKKRQMLLSLILMLVLVFALTTGVAAKSKGKSKKVTLNKTSASIAPGKTLKLKVKNSKEKATWKSSNTAVATVSRTGLVRAKKSGKATISAKVGKKTLKCKVTVKNVVKNVPLRGAYPFTIKLYVYKKLDPDKKEYKIDDYEFVPESLKAIFEEEYNKEVEEAKKSGKEPEYVEYVGVAVMSLTDACITYQNFDTALNGFKGDHRYNIGMTGSYNFPDEVAKLLEDKETWNRVVGSIGMRYTLWATNEPYTKKHDWEEDKTVYGILADMTRPSTVPGDGIIYNSITVDKQAKTFSVNLTDLTRDVEATGGSIELVNTRYQ